MKEKQAKYDIDKRLQKKIKKYVFRMNRYICAWNTGSKYDAGDNTLKHIETLKEKVKLLDPVIHDRLFNH
tara:strand:+ start:8496 stop:8705 length:210 start_codon:yes stop_codon:yes gene_type:complete